MEPTDAELDALYWEEVLAARRQTPEQKFLAGLRLFEYACEVTLSGIRHQHPEASEERVHEILRERLALARRLEERP